jgi:hypothetical protein
LQSSAQSFQSLHSSSRSDRRPQPGSRRILREKPRKAAHFYVAAKIACYKHIKHQSTIFLAGALLHPLRDGVPVSEDWFQHTTDMQPLTLRHNQRLGRRFLTA